ncbi:MAG: hypothetical protein KAI83_18875 [Thiomargarita sp.]|nr:hypothetical protein [Thiomargarita sp.]
MENGFFNRLHEFWREFMNSAIKPSILALLGTLGRLTIFLLFLTLLTPDIMATKDYGYFLAGSL